ncbi:uncharacterized protein L201_002760 [Kwoniella dendrophila CBS 6074]|uniref:Uncharacterized protein n=1 Tax=Kwoniella dendrophila CBS 6074 TaxID=1295534 RepID=A0AAX4JSH2_9TREE
MAPFSPLPPTQTSFQHEFKIPNSGVALLFGQTKTKTKTKSILQKPEKEYSKVPSKPILNKEIQATYMEILFKGGHLSFGILFCLFISTLWLLAAFSAAQLTLSIPSSSMIDQLNVTELEANLWGEVGMYELSNWRRIRTNENENSSNGNGKFAEISHRYKRNEAVLEKLRESMIDLKSNAKTSTSNTNELPVLSSSSTAVSPVQSPIPGSPLQEDLISGAQRKERRQRAMNNFSNSNNEEATREPSLISEIQRSERRQRASGNFIVSTNIEVSPEENTISEIQRDQRRRRAMMASLVNHKNNEVLPEETISEIQRNERRRRAKGNLFDIKSNEAPADESLISEIQRNQRRQRAMADFINGNSDDNDTVADPRGAETLASRKHRHNEQKQNGDGGL